MTQPVAVHFAPHPDDEVLGAPGALLALRDEGWRIVNVACSLGRPKQHEYRRGELLESCRRAGFEPRLDAVEPSRVLAELEPTLVVLPSPHDRHPFHEEVARAVLDAVRTAGSPALAWLWNLWGDCAMPSLAVELSDARLGEIVHALGAHASELSRNDLRRLLYARSAANGVLGAERIFGFASTALPFANAELLTELRLVDGRWHLCEPRALRSGKDALAGVPSSVDVTGWLAEASLTTRFGSRHA
jgi:LmbE family N-acetylglucosaminyl deacetylase